MGTSRVMTFAVVGALFALPAGCGGDDDSGDSDYAKAVETRCEQYLEERADVEKSLEPLIAQADSLTPAQVKKVAPVIDNLAQTTQKLLDDLEAIPDPEGNTEESYALVQEGVDGLDESAKAAAKGDIQGMIDSAAAGNTSLASAGEKGADFGLDACAGQAPES